MRGSVRVSVVIPVRNGARTITDQLDALAMQETNVSWEVVVADNGSTDGTRSLCETHPSHDTLPVRVVDASQMKGVNHARNRGAENARGEFIVFCDCDDVVHPGWVQAYADAATSHEKAVAAGPLVIEVVDAHGVRVRTSKVDRPRQVGEYPHGLGANFGVHRAVWEECGQFSTDFLEGFDEIEFMVRAQKNGAAFVWVDGAVVDYRLPASLKKVMRRKYKHGLMRPLMSSRHGDAVQRISAPRAMVRCATSIAKFVRDSVRGRGHRAIEECAYSFGIARGELRRRR